MRAITKPLAPFFAIIQSMYDEIAKVLISPTPGTKPIIESNPNLISVPGILNLESINFASESNCRNGRFIGGCCFMINTSQHLSIK